MSTCIESTIDVKANNSYEKEVAANIAISFGVGMAILLVTILILNFISSVISFENNTKLFDFDGKMPYPAVMIIFFLLSLSCFIGYGVRMKVGKGPTKKKDTVVSWLLAAAIISLLISATMLWFKAYVYTKKL